MVSIEIIEDLQSLIKSDYTEDVVRRLDVIGYECDLQDVAPISIAIDRVTEYIKNHCNVLEIPDGLRQTFVNMVAGTFLELKYNVNTLDLSNFDFDDIISSVSMGDASISYDKTASDVSKFKALIDTLKTSGDLVCYRKLKW